MYKRQFLMCFCDFGGSGRDWGSVRKSGETLGRLWGRLWETSGRVWEALGRKKRRREEEKEKEEEKNPPDHPNK